MSAAALLHELHAAGVALTATNGRLHVEAPKGAITPTLRERLTRAKPAIIAALTKQAGPDTIRARLLELAEFECLEPALVHRLDDADLAACTRLGDEVLTAYLRALDAAARMDAGEPPTGWTAARYCRLCGPVLLWPDCPSIVLACPWCFRRKAGRYVPRPQVQCADCVHFIRNVLNPAGGGGDCAKDRGGHWPKQMHRCAGFEPAEVATMVATGNTKKRHREESR